MRFGLILIEEMYEESNGVYRDSIRAKFPVWEIPKRTF